MGWKPVPRNLACQWVQDSIVVLGLPVNVMGWKPMVRKWDYEFIIPSLTVGALFGVRWSGLCLVDCGWGAFDEGRMALWKKGQWGVGFLDGGRAMAYSVPV